MSSSNTHLPGLQEETFSPTTGNIQPGIEAVQFDGTPPAARPTRLRRARTNIASRFRGDDDDDAEVVDANDYEAGLVDILDTIGMWNPN